MLSLFSSNLEELIIKKNISHQYVKKVDLLKKIILDSSAFKESIKLLSFEGTTEDETFYSLINSRDIFPNLEVLKIKHEGLTIHTSKLRQKLKLSKLKKLDLRGCKIKDDIVDESETKLDRYQNALLAGKLEYLDKLKKINRKAFRDQRKRRFDEKNLYYENSSSSEEDNNYNNWG